MNTQKEKKLLIICLIAELIIMFIGFVFFNPFPMDVLKSATLILYGATCCCGIYAAKVANLYDDIIHMGEIIIMCIVMVFIAPMWPFILGAIIIFTVVLLLTTDKRSSNSGGLFLVLY